MATPDITIMGAGVFGLTIAIVCARRGARVRVVDRVGIGAGSSGGIVGALAPHTPERWEPKKQFQLESLLMAQGFWDEIESISGVSSGYGRFGRLQSIETDHTLALALERCGDADELWKGQARWEVIEAQGDWHPTSATGMLVFDTLSARIHPRQACNSLAKALEILGVDVVIGACAPMGQVIWATGYEGLLRMSDEVNKPVGNGVKGQGLAVAFEAPVDAPQLFSGGVHIVPHANGTVAIGSTSERYFDDATSTDRQLDELHQKAVAICPVLRDAPIVERWAGVRPRAKTRAPMLGAWPGKTGQFIANGGFKIGFGMAPKIAHVMADLVLEGRDQIPNGFRVEDNL